MTSFDRIANSDLTLDDLPSRDDIDGIERFALSFDGYEYFGSFDGCAKEAKKKNRSTITELRNELFFAQRAARHGGINYGESLQSKYQELLPLFKQLLTTDLGASPEVEADR